MNWRSPRSSKSNFSSPTCFNIFFGNSICSSETSEMMWTVKREKCSWIEKRYAFEAMHVNCWYLTDIMFASCCCCSEKWMKTYSWIFLATTMKSSNSKSPKQAKVSLTGMSRKHKEPSFIWNWWIIFVCSPDSRGLLRPESVGLSMNHENLLGCG